MSKDDDPARQREIDAAAEALALGEAQYNSAIATSLGDDNDTLIALESARAWDVWLIDMLRERRVITGLLLLSLAASANHWRMRALAARPSSPWSGAFLRGERTDAERDGQDETGWTIEFERFAVEVQVAGETLGLTFFSSTLDVAGVHFALRSPDGVVLDRGATNMLGQLSLRIPSGAAFDVIMEPPAATPGATV